MTGSKTATKPSFPTIVGRHGSWIAQGLPIPQARSIEKAPTSVAVDLFGKVPSRSSDMPRRALRAMTCGTRPYTGNWHDDIRLSNIKTAGSTAIVLSGLDEIQTSTIPHVWWDSGDSNACIYLLDRPDGLTEVEQCPPGTTPSDYFYKPVMAWLEVPQGATWYDPMEGGAHDLFSAWAIENVAAVIAAGLNEHFESGYESTFRRNLVYMHRRFGFSAIEALCAQLKALARPYSSLLQESFAFLSAIRDEQSLDFRLVFLASYLSDSSAVNRDAAATALADLGDRRGVEYLRAAAAKEAHPRLKYEYLEIAAELGV
jgi:hypothetical protein